MRDVVDRRLASTATAASAAGPTLAAAAGVDQTRILAIELELIREQGRPLDY